MIKNFILLFFLLAVVLTMAGCAEQEFSDKKISIDGSQSMYELSCEWAKVFMEKNAEFEVEVSNSGTSRGIENFIQGNCDLVETSRKLDPEEMVRAKKNEIELDEFYVGYAVYCIIVHPENPVSKLDVGQVRDIFLGKIESWSDVGGDEAPIDVIYREIGLREYDYFLDKFIDIEENINSGTLPANARVLPEPPEIAREVSRNKNAVGYLFLQDLPPDLKTIAISEQGSSKYVRPTIEDASAFTYPILRPYFVYTARNPGKPIKKYIEFIYSFEGQDIARKMNFVPACTGEQEWGI